jgi:hypothetical protein
MVSLPKQQTLERLVESKIKEENQHLNSRPFIDKMERIEDMARRLLPWS